MKQTNNAIGFLLAQYRSIFKNAYFKGLTSAALLTAALTVGASTTAHAAVDTDSPDVKTLRNNSSIITINSDATTTDAANGIYKKFTIGDDYSKWNATVNIISGSDNNSVKAGTADTPLNIKGNGSLTIDLTSAANASNTNLTIDATTASTTVDIKDINVTKGVLAISGDGSDGAKIATLIGDNITVGGKEGASDSSKEFGKIVLSGSKTSTSDKDVYGTVLGDSESVITINKFGTIDVSASGASNTAAINAKSLNINASGTLSVTKGTLDLKVAEDINITGTGAKITTTKTDGSANISAKTLTLSSGATIGASGNVSLNITDAITASGQDTKLSVGDSQTATISTNTLTLNDGASIEVASGAAATTLNLNNIKTANINEGAHIKLTGKSGSLTINSFGGTVNFAGSQSLSLDAQASSGSVVNISGGTVNLAKGAVTVTSGGNTAGDFVTINIKADDTQTSWDEKTQGTFVKDASDAVLAIDDDDLNTLLTTDKQQAKIDIATGTLQINSDKTVKLTSFKFDTAAAGKIGTTAESVIKGDVFAITGSLPATNFSAKIISNNLILTPDDNGTALNLKGAITSNLTLDNSSYYDAQDAETHNFTLVDIRLL